MFFLQNNVYYIMECRLNLLVELVELVIHVLK